MLPVVLLATVAALAVVRPSAQQSTEPTFRSNVDFVRVDAIVTGRDDQPVTDLTEADFQLLEDGKPQKIAQFKVVHIDRSSDADVSPIETSSDEAREAARDDVRMFVLAISQQAFDCQDTIKVKSAIRGFMRTYLYPSDMVAVAELKKGNVLGEFSFTRDYDTIEAAIRRIGNPMSGPAGASDRNQVERARAALMAGPGCKNRGGEMAALQSLAVRLAELRDSRKSIIYVGGNLGSADLTLTFYELISTMNRTNTALYVVDTGGLAPAMLAKDAASASPPPRSMRPSEGFARSISLRAAAEATGGLAIVGTNNYDGNLRAVADDATFYYLLGYNSDAPHDGRFHDVDVRVRRPKVHVRSRAGFLGILPEPPKRFPSAPEPPRAVMRALGALESEATPRLMRAWAGARPSIDGRARVAVAWEPVGQPQTPERRYVSVVASDASATVVWRTPEDGKLESFGLTGSRHGASFDAMPGRMTLRISITDASGSVLDNQTFALDVPDFTVPRTRVSDPWVFRAGSARDLRLIDEDPDALPAAGRLFSKTDHLVVRFDRINGDQTRAALLNRAGQTMRELPVTPAPGGAFDQIDLGLNTIPPGEYILEMTTGDADDARTLVAFRVRG
jgi:VWFA-related protein